MIDSDVVSIKSVPVLKKQPFGLAFLSALFQKLMVTLGRDIRLPFLHFSFLKAKQVRLRCIKNILESFIQHGSKSFTFQISASYYFPLLEIFVHISMHCLHHARWQQLFFL
jgi:hypothetical protein